MKNADDIRHDVMQMESHDCRQELADALEILSQLSFHFDLVCEALHDLMRHDHTGGPYVPPPGIESVLRQRGLLR